jgi:hypothetical protein
MITDDPITQRLLAIQIELGAVRDLLEPLDLERRHYSEVAMGLTRLVGRRVGVLANGAKPDRMALHHELVRQAGVS